MRESFSSGLMHHCVQVLKEQESQRSGPDCPLKLISWLCSAKKHPAIASLVQQEDREARDEGKVKNPQLMGLKKSTQECLPTTFGSTEPGPLHPLLPQPPAPAPHASAPLASSPQLPFPRGPRSPSRTVPAPALTSHPTLPHRRSPTRSGRSPGSQRALPSLPSLSSTPQTSSPRHGGLPASGPEAHPRHIGQAPPRQPLLPPSRVEGSLLRRGV